MTLKNRLYLPLFILLGLTFCLSQWVHAEITARETPHAPDWQGTATTISEAGQVADSPFLAASANGNKLIVVFNRRIGAGNNKDPYYNRSTNGGATWLASPAPIYTSLTESSLEVNVTIDGSGTGHAVWVESEYRVLYAAEPSWGGSTPTPISDDITDIQASNPQIVATGSNTLHVIWSATNAISGLTQIWHKRSDNGGSTWSAKDLVSSNALEAIAPHMSADGQGNLHVVWEQTSNISEFKSYIYYTKGTVSGQAINWSTAVRIGDVDDVGDNWSARQPKISATGRLRVAFTAFEDNEVGEDDLEFVHYVTCSSNCQTSQNWSNDQNISGTALRINANLPNRYIVSDIFEVRGCAYIYFHGIDNIFVENNEQIIGANSCDGWSAGRNGRDVITQPQNQSLHVSAAITDAWIHVVYEQGDSEGQTTTRQIYYLRGAPPPYTVLLPLVRR